MNVLRRLVGFVVVLVSMVLSSYAAAQSAPPTGTRLNTSPNEVELGEMRVIQRKFAACLYDFFPDQSEELLNSSDFLNFDEEASEIAWNWLGSDRGKRCLWRAVGQRSGQSTTMTVPVPVLRNLLTEAAYLKENNGALETNSDDSEILTTRYFALSQDPDQARLIAGFGDCVVYRQPELADNLLRTKPASEGEGLAVGALAPHLGDCLQSGRDISLTPASLRTIVADGLWARSQNQIARAQEATGAND